MSINILRKANDDNVEYRIAKASAVAVLLWWLAYTPYTAAALLGQFGGEGVVTPMAAMFPAILLKISNSFNPIIYAFKHPK